MNPETPQFSSEAPESKQEQEDFEPGIVFDFIRHGQAEYGEAVKDELEELGYEWEEILSSSKTAENVESPADLEGRITEKGLRELQEAVKDLTERINKDEENLMVLFSPRARTIESAQILLDGLEESGVDVDKAREHADLIDMQQHWLAIFEFVKEVQTDADNPFSYWLDMSAEEIDQAEIEGFENIGERMDHFIDLITRYARRYEDQLDLDEKKLRVIAMTHDLNLMSILEREGISSKEAERIQNAQVMELGVNEEGDSQLLN